MSSTSTSISTSTSTSTSTSSSTSTSTSTSTSISTSSTTTTPSFLTLQQLSFVPCLPKSNSSSCIFSSNTQKASPSPSSSSSSSKNASVLRPSNVIENSSALLTLLSSKMEDTSLAMASPPSLHPLPLFNQRTNSDSLLFHHSKQLSVPFLKPTHPLPNATLTTKTNPSSTMTSTASSLPPPLKSQTPIFIKETTVSSLTPFSQGLGFTPLSTSPRLSSSHPPDLASSQTTSNSKESPLHHPSSTHSTSYLSTHDTEQDTYSNAENENENEQERMKTFHSLPSSSLHARLEKTGSSHPMSSTTTPTTTTTTTSPRTKKWLSHFKYHSQPSVSFTSDLGTIRFFRRNDRPKDIQTYTKADEPIAPQSIYHYHSLFQSNAASSLLNPTMTTLKGNEVNETLTFQFLECQCDPMHLSMSFLVQVPNWAYEKEVFIKWTQNHWESHASFHLSYTSTLHSKMDLFQGTLHLPWLPSSSPTSSTSSSPSSLASSSPTFSSPKSLSTTTAPIHPLAYEKIKNLLPFSPPMSISSSSIKGFESHFIRFEFCCCVKYPELHQEVWDNRKGQNYVIEISKLHLDSEPSKDLPSTRCNVPLDTTTFYPVGKEEPENTKEVVIKEVKEDEPIPWF